MNSSFIIIEGLFVSNMVAITPNIKNLNIRFGRKNLVLNPMDQHFYLAAFTIQHIFFSIEP